MLSEDWQVELWSVAHELPQQQEVVLNQSLQLRRYFRIDWSGDVSLRVFDGRPVVVEHQLARVGH